MSDEDSVPAVRATVRGGRVILNAWDHGLVTGGPAGVHLERARRRGVVLADLTPLPGDELLVEWVPADAVAGETETALLAWAAHVGYGRVWLPERVVALEPDGGDPPAEVRCPTCGSRFRDGGRRFWDGVRAAGSFPGRCPVCAGSLPEWRVQDRRVAVSHVARGVKAPGAS